MKKSLLVLLFMTFCLTNISIAAEFPQALKTCEKFSQVGSASYNNEIFNISITLDKAKNGKCVYKEKIYQGKDYQMLTCNFDSGQLPALSASMETYNNKYKKEISKNKIFEAKMTTNADVFQKFLSNPKYCTITHSKK